MPTPTETRGAAAAVIFSCLYTLVGLPLHGALGWLPLLCVKVLPALCWARVVSSSPDDGRRRVAAAFVLCAAGDGLLAAPPLGNGAFTAGADRRETTRVKPRRRFRARGG